MGRERARFVCEQCGAESLQWQGQCPACAEWNTLVEFRPADMASHSAGRLSQLARLPAAEVPPEPTERYETGLPEFDRVLGGGLVPGVLVLLSGDPGIGKSTLLLQAASGFAADGGSCLYVSGEESVSQVALRSRRVGAAAEGLLLLAESDVGAICRHVEQARPGLLIVDSIQALYSPEIASPPGSVSQVRDYSTRLLRVPKDLGSRRCSSGM